jgi:hypothetical protein
VLVFEILLNVTQGRLGVAVVRLGTYYDSCQGDIRYRRDRRRRGDRNSH